MALTFKEAWNAKPDGRSREELFQDIVDDVKKRSGNTLSDVEAHTAARNLVAFMRELMGLSQEETLGRLDCTVQPVIVEKEHE